MRSLGTRLPQTDLPVVSQREPVLRFLVAEVAPFYGECFNSGGSNLESKLLRKNRLKLVPHEALLIPSADLEKTFIRKFQLGLQTRSHVALPRTRTSGTRSGRALRC